MTPDVVLLLIGDGRDEYRRRTLESARDRAQIFHQIPEAAVVEIDDRTHQLGFAGAVQAGWDAVLDHGAEYVFHLEADFTFNTFVSLAQMVQVLNDHPELAQIVLKRQPWNDLERAAGGIVEQHPDDYTERRYAGNTWCEHTRFFSTNPCLYRAELCRRGWPQRPQSEGIFGLDLLRDHPETRFAYWGGKFDPPAVHHIGAERAGTGY